MKSYISRKFPLVTRTIVRNAGSFFTSASIAVSQGWTRCRMMKSGFEPLR
jgi:hypothetical protein